GALAAARRPRCPPPPRRSSSPIASPELPRPTRGVRSSSTPRMAASTPPTSPRSSAPPRRSSTMPGSGVTGPAFPASPICKSLACPPRQSATTRLASAHHDAIVLTGSHGGLLGGRPETALKYEVRAAFYNDAGIGIDEAGVSRLPALDDRGIAAATVSAATARIGEARSTYEDGILS